MYESTFFHKGGEIVEQLPQVTVESPSLKVFKALTSPLCLALLWAVRLDYIISTGAFQSQPACDCKGACVSAAVGEASVFL